MACSPCLFVFPDFKFIVFLLWEITVKIQMTHFGLIGIYKFLSNKNASWNEIVSPSNTTCYRQAIASNHGSQLCSKLTNTKLTIKKRDKPNKPFDIVCTTILIKYVSTGNKTIHVKPYLLRSFSVTLAPNEY